MTQQSRKHSAAIRRRFEEEALPHLGAITGYAVRLCRDRILAEDLVQETFLQAWRGFHTYRAGTSCRAWLARICRNCFLDSLRRNKVRPRPASIENIEVADDAEYDGNDVVLERIVSGKGTSELFGDEVQRELERLPEHSQQVLLLSDVAGLSYEEITRVLGLPLGTVRSRLSRAREYLRRGLENIVNPETAELALA